MTWTQIQPLVHLAGLITLMATLLLYFCGWFYRRGRLDEGAFNEVKDWTLFLTRRKYRRPGRQGFRLNDGGGLTTLGGLYHLPTAEVTRAIWKRGRQPEPQDMAESMVRSARVADQVMADRRRPPARRRPNYQAGMN